MKEKDRQVVQVRNISKHPLTKLEAGAASMLSDFVDKLLVGKYSTETFLETTKFF